ncbi:MAG: Leucine aminopeptidase-related protein, partial [Bryobacterales bacterium]|nr:Leucine aminopeptidase-related protein [Bryobacterales bacterium]
VGGNATPDETLQDITAVRVFSEGIPASSSPEQIKRILNLGEESDSPARELARAVSDIARTYTADPERGTSGLNAVLEFRHDRYLRGGDHTSFSAQGFPAVRFTEWREDFRHQHQNLRTENGAEYGDLLKFVDFSYVAQVARLNAAVLAVTASAPAIPRNVHIVTKELVNDSTLQWDNPEGAPAGTRYEVVWRETASGGWQFAADAGTANTLTLPVSKDNVIFGVRSVDSAGHRSPTAAPE